MRALVYTAIFGGYETLKQPVPQNEPCDFVCFTDSKMQSRENCWQIIPVRRDPKIHSRMQAKRFKILSHKVFPGGRLTWRHAPFRHRSPVNLTIWIDGSLEIKSSTFVEDMRAALATHDWAVFAHPDRDCIYEEAVRSAPLDKYRNLPILAQTETYRGDISPHGGLYACGVIVRREPLSERVRKANELWWQENISWSYQDQLSFPYVLKKTGATVAVIPGNLWKNEWFEVGWYKNDSRPKI
jgi:hypothetical protein